MAYITGHADLVTTGCFQNFQYYSNSNHVYTLKESAGFYKMFLNHKNAVCAESWYKRSRVQ